MSPESMREVQQLWSVALNYLEASRDLKNDARTYEDLLTSPDPGLLALSADLDSAAIRLASLDYLLNGGMNAVRSRAYLRDSGSGKGAWRREYMHVFLRDAVAHAEPVEGVDRDRHTERQAWLRTLTLQDTWEAVDMARRRLNNDIVTCCKSASDLENWMKNDLDTWLISMRKRTK